MEAGECLGGLLEVGEVAGLRGEGVEREGFFGEGC